MKDRKFKISIEPSSLIPNLTIITIAGNLDLSTSKYFDEKVLPFVEKGESNIIIDLSQLEYLSSIGMMSLTQFHALLMKKDRILKLIKPPEKVYNTMAVFGFAKRFDIYDTLEAAIDSF